MYGLRLFTRERSFSKQIMRWERWRKDYNTYKIVMAACLLLLLPNIRNSCLNFPLSCVSIVLRQGGNWSLRARGDSCLFFKLLQQWKTTELSLYKKGLLTLYAAWLYWGKEWEAALAILCCCNKTLSLISAADMLSAKLNLPRLLADTDPRRSCSKRMNVSSI